MKIALNTLFVVNALLALALAIMHDALFPFNALVAMFCYFVAKKI